MKDQIRIFQISSAGDYLYGLDQLGRIWQFDGNEWIEILGPEETRMKPGRRELDGTKFIT